MISVKDGFHRIGIHQHDANHRLSCRISVAVVSHTYSMLNGKYLEVSLDDCGLQENAKDLDCNSQVMKGTVGNGILGEVLGRYIRYRQSTTDLPSPDLAAIGGKSLPSY